jgi:hypothetical protein
MVTDDYMLDQFHGEHKERSLSLDRLKKKRKIVCEMIISPFCEMIIAPFCETIIAPFVKCYVQEKFPPAFCPTGILHKLVQVFSLLSQLSRFYLNLI